MTGEMGGGKRRRVVAQVYFCFFALHDGDGNGKTRGGGQCGRVSGDQCVASRRDAVPAQGVRPGVKLG